MGFWRQMRVKAKGGATRSIDGDDEKGVGQVAWRVKLMARRWKFDDRQSHVMASRGSDQYTQTNTQIRKAGDHSEIMLDQCAWLISKLSTYAIITSPRGFKFQPSWVDSSWRSPAPLSEVSLKSGDARVLPSTMCVTGMKDCERAWYGMSWKAV